MAKKKETSRPREPKRTKELADDGDTLRELYHSMLLQRRFEERVGEAYALGKIGGFCHLYIGQEAIAAGVMSVLREDDYVITTYRDHGQALARGLSARAIMAELFGRIDGCSGGKGGSMHLFDRDLNFMGGHGIVGGHIPLASGVGFAIKYRGGDQVCVCFMGEAAAHGGAFHESLNMAARWGLPVVFMIENNRYGMGTEFSRVSSTLSLASRGASYGMAHATLDGQDVLAVRDAVAAAVDQVRAEQRPYLFEISTYRFRGHSMSDAVSGTYRSKEELDEHMKRDPLELFKARLLEDKVLEDADFDEMEKEIAAIVDDSWEFADASPEPPPEALFEDVLVLTSDDNNS